MNPSSRSASQRYGRHALWVILALCLGGPRASLGQVDLSRLQLPPGFVIEAWADHVPDARQMAAGPPGVIYVGSRALGQVRAVVDADHDGRSDRVLVIAHGLEMSAQWDAGHSTKC